MAVTQQADMFIPEVTRDLILEGLEDFFPDWGFLLMDFDPQGFSPSVGGNSYIWPYGDSFDHEMDDLGTGSLTPETITQDSFGFQIRRKGKAYEIKDIAKLASRRDPNTYISEGILQVLKQTFQRDILNTSYSGALATTDTRYLSATQSTANLRTVKNLAGDRQGELNWLVVHSDVWNVIKDDVSYQPRNQIFDITSSNRAQAMNMGNDLVPTLAGAVVIVTDFATFTTSGSPASNTYRSFLFKDKALGLAVQRDLLVDTDRDVKAVTDVIVPSIHYALGTMGVDEDSGSPATFTDKWATKNIGAYVLEGAV